MIKIYGIPSCDTMKKATTWLKENNLIFEFHDYKKLGIQEEKLTEWLVQMSWETLVNRKGTTWKKLPEEVKLSVNNNEAVIEVLKNNTSAIKRPILEVNGIVAGIGFEAEGWEKIFK
jgi:arsenate reductase (glutaredoxin)